jgi:hypothetical protein
MGNVLVATAHRPFASLGPRYWVVSFEQLDYSDDA